MHAVMFGILTLAAVSAPGASDLTINWGEFGAVISSIGALGVAAFGVVESLGKALTFTYTSRPYLDDRPGPATTIRVGLPYVGFRAIRVMMRPLTPALECAYGEGYMEIIAQQYRADRSAGRAPDTIREGVKLGLPFLSLGRAASVIDHVWKMDRHRATELAAALGAEPGADGPAAPSTPEGAAQLLAGRFATALDERVNAAFSLAESQYSAAMHLWAGVAAVVLAFVFNYSLGNRFGVLETALIGIAAVPLAPVAKDLASSLQNALTAFKSIPTKRA